jgi:hypothetical protein
MVRMADERDDMADGGDHADRRPSGTERPDGSTRPQPAIPPGSDADTPAVDPWAAGDVTAVGPQVDGPDATTVAPRVEDAQPRWTARAAVRPGTPDAQPADWPEDDPYHGRSWLRPVIIGIVVLVLLAMLVVGVWLLLKRTPTVAPGPVGSASPSAAVTSTSRAPSPTRATSAPPTTAAATSAAAAMVPVPDVVGAPAAEARRTLTGAGLTVREQRRTVVTEEPGTVLEITPAAGTSVPVGSEVVIVVATRPPRSSAPVSPAAVVSPSATKTK